MSQRLVVCLRWRPPEEGEAPEQAAQATQRALSRVAALGGRVVLWHPEWIGADFDHEALQDAMDFLIDRPPDRFGAGFAYGELNEVIDGGNLLAVATGSALDTAVALARMARIGEVLIDPDLVRASAGEILTTGARAATFRGEKIRGLSLDLAHPQRSLEADSVSRLVRAPWVGAPVALPYQAGELSLVCGAAGAGRTRYLAEFEADFAPGALKVVPGALGQPLGALRYALSASALRAGGVPALAEPERDSHEALAEGEGVSHDAAAALIQRWIELHKLPRVVLIDDTFSVDSDTLEALRVASESYGIALVAAVGVDTMQPAALKPLTLSAIVSLPALEESNALTLVQNMCSAPLDDALARRVVQRAGPLALDIVESLVESFDSASLLFNEAGIESRFDFDVRERRTADRWLRRRLLFLDSKERVVLDAVAVIGGRSEPAELEQVLSLAGRPQANLEQSLANLVRLRWLARGPGSIVSLSSTTSARIITGSLSRRRYRALHQAVAGARAALPGSLSLASAALHAQLAGNEGKAKLLARRAATSTRAAGLEDSARALEQFAETGDPATLLERGILPGAADEPAEKVPEAHDDHLFSSRPGAPRSLIDESFEPEPPTERARAGSSHDAMALATTDPELSASLSGSNGAPPLSLADVLEGPESGAEAALSGRSDVSYTSALRDNDSLLPARAAAALQGRDAPTLNALAADLRQDGMPILAERLEALAQLVLGHIGDALRRLREAQGLLREDDLSGRCRSVLALAVALALAGRHDDALLEALGGLAYARQGQDERGERACLRFIGQLAEAQGYPELSSAWEGALEVVS